MIRSLAHCGGNFRKTATLLLKYVIKAFVEYGRHSKRTDHGEQFGRQLHPRGPHVSLGSLLPKLVLCSRCFLCESANELVNHPLLHCTFSKQIWTMFRAIFGVQWVIPGCIKLALSSWYDQLHQGTMSTTKLLFLPAFSVLFGGRGMVDVSMMRSKTEI